MPEESKKLRKEGVKHLQCGAGMQAMIVRLVALVLAVLFVMLLLFVESIFQPSGWFGSDPWVFCWVLLTVAAVLCVAALWIRSLSSRNWRRNYFLEESRADVDLRRMIRNAARMGAKDEWSVQLQLVFCLVLIGVLAFFVFLFASLPPWAGRINHSELHQINSPLDQPCDE